MIDLVFFGHFWPLLWSDVVKNDQIDHSNFKSFITHKVVHHSTGVCELSSNIFLVTIRDHSCDHRSDLMWSNSQYKRTPINLYIVLHHFIRIDQFRPY